MIKQTAELKARFLIMMVAFIIATFTCFSNYYLHSDTPEYAKGTKPYITNNLPQWTYNPYDYYNSKLENFIIYFGYGVFLLMLIDILLICENDSKNINSRKNNKVNIKKIGEKNDNKK